MYDESVDSAVCINFAHRVTEGYTYFYLSVFIEGGSAEDFSLLNCSMIANEDRDTNFVMTVSVTDPSQPAYVSYGGAIIAVFNYS